MKFVRQSAKIRTRSSPLKPTHRLHHRPDVKSTAMGNHSEAATKLAPNEEQPWAVLALAFPRAACRTAYKIDYSTEKPGAPKVCGTVWILK
jgi:hypothetical protein